MTKDKIASTATYAGYEKKLSPEDVKKAVQIINDTTFPVFLFSDYIDCFYEGEAVDITYKQLNPNDKRNVKAILAPTKYKKVIMGI